MKEQKPRSGNFGPLNWVSVSLLAVLMASGVATLAIIGLTRWQSYPTTAPPPVPSPLQTVEERQKTLEGQMNVTKAQFESYKTQIDDLQRLTTLLVGLSSFYALVLGATSYLTGFQFTDRIRIDSERAERNVLALEKNFPVFTNFAENIDKGINKLLRDFPTDEERDEYYNRLSATDRERILFYERSMAFLDYFELKEKTAKLYHGLGMFYSARHSAGTLELDGIRAEQGANPTADSKLLLAERERSIREDCVRACFYLQMSVSGDSRNLMAQNDLGLALSDLAGLETADHAKTESLRGAEHSFVESSRIEPNQQRAYYNLARALAERKDYRSAIQKLTEALRHANWQTKPNALRTKDIHYNRACYRCRLAENEAVSLSTIAKQNALREITEDFHSWRNGYNATPVVLKEMLKTLEADVQPGGDLSWLNDRNPDLVKTTIMQLRGA